MRSSSGCFCAPRARPSFPTSARSWPRRPSRWQPSLEVWAAPSATLAASAHRLASLDSGAPQYITGLAMAFDSIYEFQNDTHAVHVVRAGDGAVTTVLPGEGREMHVPLLVTTSELWAITMPRDGAVNTMLARFSLGPW